MGVYLGSIGGGSEYNQTTLNETPKELKTIEFFKKSIAVLVGVSIWQTKAE